MASFDYTAKSWSKLKPLMMKSTGLGKALESYEKSLVVMKAQLNFQSTLEGKKRAETALEEVEKCKKLAISLAEKDYPKVATALKAEKGADQLEEIRLKILSMLNIMLAKGVVDFKKARAGVNWDERYRLARKTRNDLKVAVEARLTNLDTQGIVALADFVKNRYLGDLTTTQRSTEGLGSDVPKMLLMSSKLTATFPEMSGDLAKLKKLLEEIEKLDEEYATNRQDIVKLDGAFRKIWAER